MIKTLKYVAHESENLVENDLFLDCSLKTENLMTSEEAASFLKISVGTLRNLTSNGHVPYYKLGRRNRYILDDLRKLVLSNKRGNHGY
jgi:excisionase family DNA binding protein